MTVTFKIPVIPAGKTLVAGPASLALSALSLAAYLAGMVFCSFLQSVP